MNEITAKTAIEDVLDGPGARVRLVRLAQLVMDCPGIQYMPAFTQFRSSEDLATLIEAKRKGIFDYGACLVKTDMGLRYPNDTDAVLRALRCALNGNYGEIDIQRLGLFDVTSGEPLVSIHDICPGIGKTPIAEKPQELPVVRRRATKAESQTNTDEPVNREPEQNEADMQVKATNVDVLERLNSIATALSDSFKYMESNSNERHAMVCKAIETLSNALKANTEAIRELQAHLGNARPAAPIEVHQAAPRNGMAQRQAPSDIQVNAFQAKAPQHEEVSYTRADLQRLSVNELQAIAASIGIANAEKMGFKQPLINRILNS